MRNEEYAMQESVRTYFLPSICSLLKTFSWEPGDIVGIDHYVPSFLTASYHPSSFLDKSRTHNAQRIMKYPYCFSSLFF